MSDKAIPARVAIVIHGKSRFTVSIHWLPGVKDLLQLRERPDSEPVLLKVREVTFVIGQDDGSEVIEIRVNRVQSTPLPIDAILQFLNPRQDAFLPRIGDSVVLHKGGTPLKVSRVIHDIDQSTNRHTTQIQLFDASLRRPVFAVRDIEEMVCDDDEDEIPLHL